MPLFKTKTSQNVLAKEGYKQVVKLILAAYLWGNEQAKDDDAPKEIKKNKKGMRQPPLRRSRQKPFILEEHLFIYYLVCHTQNNGMNGTLSVFMEQKWVPTKLVTSKGRCPLLIAASSAKFTLSRLPRLVFQSIPKKSAHHSPISSLFLKFACS